MIEKRLIVGLFVVSAMILTPPVLLGQDGERPTFESTKVQTPDPEPDDPKDGDNQPSPAIEVNIPALSDSTLSLAAPVAQSRTIPAATKKPKQDKQADSEPLVLSAEDMVSIFQGDLSSLGRDDSIKVVGAAQGDNPIIISTQRVGDFSVHRAIPSPATRSPEQCLGIAVAAIEKQIAAQNRELVESNDTESREALIKKLSDSYRTRFELDTAFQDFKVSEIERRAKKLRAEVEARQSATQQWVDAMVTLAKMKADGIETMNVPQTRRGATYPQPSGNLTPTPFSAPRTLPGPPSAATPAGAANGFSTNN